MEYQHKLLIVAFLLVGLALFVFYNAPKAALSNSGETEKLLLKAMSFGKGENNYTYSYSDISDGYKNTYTVIKNGDIGSVELKNPISTKKVYITPTETVLCINYIGQNRCGSVKDIPILQNYIEFIKSKFFNDLLIDKNKNDLIYLIDNKYIVVDPNTVQKTINSIPCTQVTYRLDMTNISLTDAAKFSVGSNSPRIFDWNMCIENGTGAIVYRKFNYTAGNVMHTSEFQLIEAKLGSAVNMTLPEELGSVVELYEAERESQVQLAKCYTEKQGDNRDKCVSDIGLMLKRPDVCEMANNRRDLCLLTLVPLLKDGILCQNITKTDYQDDCYIELAGAYKNSSYCTKINNQAKIAICQDASVIVPKIPAVGENTTNQSGGAGNKTNKTLDPTVKKLFEKIETEGAANQTTSNSTNNTNNTKS